MSNVGAPSTHKQPSRKGKKAWRKNVDITTVQEGLENASNEIRIHGGVLSEQKSEDLFALDILGSKEIVKKHNLQKPLKADEILARRSAVPAVDSRKRTSTDLEIPDGIYEPKRRRGDWVTKKEVQRLKKTINTTTHLPNDVESTPTLDLWDQAQPQPTATLEYIPAKQAKVAPSTIKRAPTALTLSGKAVAPVTAPREGHSYNPDYEHWEALLTSEGQKAVEAEKRRLAIEAAEAERQARIAAVRDDEPGYRTDEESAWEGFETENEEVTNIRTKRPVRKTPVERNKVKRRQEAERRAKHDAKMANRKLIVTADELKALTTTSDGDKQVVEPMESDDNISEDDRRLRRRRLGNAAIPEANLEIVLPDELRDSLRLLKPEGNLLQDRFRNLLVNGKIETKRLIVQPKKRKVKMTEKWTHKDFSIEV